MLFCNLYLAKRSMDLIKVEKKKKKRSEDTFNMVYLQAVLSGATLTGKVVSGCHPDHINSFHLETYTRKASGFWRDLTPYLHPRDCKRYTLVRKKVIVHNFAYRRYPSLGLCTRIYPLTNR